MHPLERITRLEQVIENLDGIVDLFPEFSVLWQHVNKESVDEKSIQFYSKVAMAIAILRNQVDFERRIISRDDDKKISLQ